MNFTGLGSCPTGQTDSNGVCIAGNVPPWPVLCFSNPSAVGGFNCGLLYLGIAVVLFLMMRK
jgi:hypothetical protein